MRKTSEKTATGGKGPTAPAGRSDGESAVLAKIAEMPEPYRTMGARLHSMIDSISPVLSPKVWYGMPAYAKEGKVVCFFRGSKEERYMTIGFTEDSNLEDGNMWPTSFAVKELTSAEEEIIAALVKKAAN